MEVSKNSQITHSDHHPTTPAICLSFYPDSFILQIRMSYKISMIGLNFSLDCLADLNRLKNHEGRHH